MDCMSILLLSLCYALSRAGAVGTSEEPIGNEITPELNEKVVLTDADPCPCCQPHLISRLTELTAKVERLEYKCTAFPKVAFAANLENGENIRGPFNANVYLVYKKVLTNVGNAYNPGTGIFTAPVMGVYYFAFTCNTGNSGGVNAALLKNGQNMVAVIQKGTVDNMGSNSVVLLLDAGDQINIMLWLGNSIYDNGHRSSFSGALLFPL